MIKAENVEIKRDFDGMWMHPSFPWSSLPEECDVSPFIEEWGYEARFQSLEGDAPPEISERYANANEPDCSYWTPTRPDGDGWLLGAIYDTWDGPVALWMRPRQEPAPEGV